MFNKLKQFKDLRDQAKVMQNALSGEVITAEKNGVKIVMNGNLEVDNVTISEELAKENLEQALKTCINDAVKKTQRIMAKKMQEMGGIPGMN